MQFDRLSHVTGSSTVAKGGVNGQLADCSSGSCRHRRDPARSAHRRDRPGTLGAGRPGGADLWLRAAARRSTDVFDVHHPHGDHRRVDDAVGGRD